MTFCKFCDVCNNILYINTDDKLTFHCNTCLNVIEGEDKDTLLLDINIHNKVNVFDKYATFINIAEKDKTLPYIEKKCTKRQETIIKYAVLGDDMIYLYICTTCGNKFID